MMKHEIDMTNSAPRHIREHAPSQPVRTAQTADAQGTNTAGLNELHSNAIAAVDQSPVPLSDPTQMLTSNQRDRAFDVIRRCRKLIDCKEPSDISQADYSKKFRQLTKHFGPPGPRPDVEAWAMTLAPYLDAPRSFRAYRAALCYGLRKEMRAAMVAQDRMQRMGGPTLDWLAQVVLLKSLLKLLEHIEASSRDTPFWAEKKGSTRHGTSKKQDLKIIARRAPEWSQTIVRAMAGTQYIDATLLSEMAGPRPEELKKGVRVERVDTSRFAIVIEGAKVSHIAGQEWRRLLYSNELLPSTWQSRLQANESFVIQIASTKAYSSSMSRVSQRVLKDCPAVTPYVFRHALPDRLRDHGRSTEEIAGAMGHSVAETQALYGGRAGGGRRRAPDGLVPLSIETARPVRPLDRSGLQTVMSRGKAKKRKGSEPGLR